MAVRVLIAVLMAGLVALTPSSGGAIPIQYFFSGTATGNLGATNFSSAEFTVTALADTANVMEIFGPNVFTVLAPAAMIEIGGVGTVNVTEETGVFSNQNVAAAGYSRFNGNNLELDLLDINCPPCVAYDLRGPFGPVFDPTPFAVNQFQNLQTDGGLLTFSTAQLVTFLATTQRVAEPASLLLLGAGLFSLGVAGRLRRITR